MIQFFPAISGAACAFIALKLVAPLEGVAHKLVGPVEGVTLWLEIVIYAVVFVAVTLAIDRAMSRYGR